MLNNLRQSIRSTYCAVKRMLAEGLTASTQF